MQGPVRVVYIMGYGRSGSTVLDTVLGNHARAAGFGELSHLVADAWLGDGRCACGELGGSCAFWREVRKRWEVHVPDAERYVALQRRFELGLARWRRAFQRSAYLEWAEATRRLYEAIRDVSGVDAVVDSSKNPTRAWALTGVEGIDVFYVHLVRDGRGVAWSLSKSYAKDDAAGIQRDLPGRSVLRTAFQWKATNRRASRLRKVLPHDRRLFLRYEDYLDDLASALSPLASFVGGDFEAVASAVERGEPLDVGHTIAGNRLRMSGKIRLKADHEWRERMPESAQRLFWLVAGGAMRGFDYAR